MKKKLLEKILTNPIGTTEKKILLKLIDDKSCEFHSLRKELGIDNSNFHKSVNKLIDVGVIIKKKGNLVLV